jgi:hypothetical protein
VAHDRARPVAQKRVAAAPSRTDVAARRPRSEPHVDRAVASLVEEVRPDARHCHIAEARRGLRVEDHLAAVPRCVRCRLAGRHTTAQLDDHSADRRAGDDRWIRRRGVAGHLENRRAVAGGSPVEDRYDAHRLSRRRLPADRARHSSCDLAGRTAADVLSLMGVGRTA